MKLKSEKVIARTRKLKAKWSIQAQQDLMAMHMTATKPKPLTKCFQCNEDVVVTDAMYIGRQFRDNIETAYFHVECFEELAGRKFVDMVSEKVEQEKLRAIDMQEKIKELEKLVKEKKEREVQLKICRCGKIVDTYGDNCSECALAYGQPSSLPPKYTWDDPSGYPKGLAPNPLGKLPWEK